MGREEFSFNEFLWLDFGIKNEEFFLFWTQFLRNLCSNCYLQIAEYGKGIFKL